MHCWSSVFEFIVELFQCCLVGRRVGIGRVQSLFLMCLVNVGCRCHRFFFASVLSFSLRFLFVESCGRLVVLPITAL